MTQESSSKFKVGDIVVGIGFVEDTYLNGTEGTVVECLGVVTLVGRLTGKEDTTDSYVVQWQFQEDGEADNISHYNLKLKKPDVSGEEEIIRLFGLNFNKYNMTEYEVLKKEMEVEREVEMV
jgi:hypothetical protein